MTEQQNNTALSALPKQAGSVGGGQVVPIVAQNMAEAWQLSQLMFGSGIVPKSFENAKQVMLAIQMGADLGFTPTQALANIAVINGKPSVFGDGLTAIARRAGNTMKEWSTGDIEKGDYTAHCKITRADTGEEIERSFSISDARRAGLWVSDPVNGKFEKQHSTPWYKYPKRMMMWRARGWAVRDGLADQMYGLAIAEEQQDIISHNEEAAAIEAAPSRLEAKLLPQGGGAVIEGETKESPQEPQESETTAQAPIVIDFDEALQAFTELYGESSEDGLKTFLYEGVTYYTFPDYCLDYDPETDPEESPDNEFSYDRPALNDEGAFVRFGRRMIERLVSPDPKDKPVGKAEATEISDETKQDNVEQETSSHSELDGEGSSTEGSPSPSKEDLSHLSIDAKEWIQALDEIELDSLLENWPIEQDLEWFVVMPDADKELVRQLTEDAIERRGV